jgi:hypothetical protein
MRSTQKGEPRFDLLKPASAVVFAILVVLGVVIGVMPEWESFTPRAVARIAGYVGFAAMLVPYLHIVRRCFRYRQAGQMTFWLRLHVGFAYLAFFMVLLHSRGRANGPLTLALLWLTWTVMVSGVAGYFGQKLLYLLLPHILPREYGLERLGAERAQMIESAEAELKKKEMQTTDPVVRDFCAAAVRDRLTREYSWSGWLRPRRAATILSPNGYQRARSFADAKQQAVVDRIWGFVEARRAMDLEYGLHQLGRSWLLVHGPAAWALVVLMVEHVVMSWWYGGF